MADTKYTYTVSTDFPNGKVDIPRLEEEIEDSDITIALRRIDVDLTADTCAIWFKDVLDATNQTRLAAVVAVHNGEPLPGDVLPVSVDNQPGVDSLNRTITVPEPETDRKMVNIVSHNFCDTCTWWQNATEVTDQALTEDTGTVFSSPNERWIDLTHGRLYLEDRVEDRVNYIPVIKVDDVVKVEKPPFNLPGAYDYEVDYASGKITFQVDQTGKTVTASYYYGGSSAFTVRPDPGKVLWVRDSEVQFSSDIVMTSTINFQAWAYNPGDLPNKMPVTAMTNYKTLRNFVEEAKGVYPLVPAIGGAIRGMTQEHVVFPFKYSQVKTLTSSQGVEIRVWMDEDVEFAGEFGTVTFYCSSYDES